MYAVHYVRRPKYFDRPGSKGKVYLQNRSRSTLNMVIEKPHAISYLMANVMFAISVTILEIFSVKRYMTLTTEIFINL